MSGPEDGTWIDWLDAGGTIRPPEPAPWTLDLERLPKLALEPTDGDHADLILGEPLGEGGMGVVHRATQRGLDRTVAVKRLKDPDREAQRQLLREAWVTGRVEHPNVVPVHLLGRTEAGELLFVMKRVEGVPWSHVVHDPARHPDAQDDPLGFHLATLMSVCQAVHYAHTRGVLHRDLKPDNVMIGPFGEVYVLDWGLALATEQQVAGPLQHTSEVTTLAGTPAFMAPEQARAESDRFGPPTDVFALGAILYQVLTRRLPREGDVMTQVRAAAACTPLAFAGDEPPELVRICREATKDEGRTPSAERLRQQLREALSHRSFDALLEAGETRRRELAELESGAADLADVERVATEARFAYAQALQAWPENAAARQGRELTVHSLARCQLAADRVDAAATTLAAADRPPPALALQIRQRQQALADREAEVAALEDFAEAMDTARGTRRRATVSGLMALLFPPVALVFQLAPDWSWYGLLWALFATILLGTLLSAVVAPHRNQADDAQTRVLLLGLAAQLLGVALSWSAGAAVAVAMAWVLLVTGLLFGALTLVLDRRFSAPALILATAAAAVVALPGAAWLWIGSGAGAALAAASLVWWQRMPDGA